jgi:hypothetical protein
MNNVEINKNIHLSEHLIEQSAKSLWIHFAVRPFANRRRIRLMKG